MKKIRVPINKKTYDKFSAISEKENEFIKKLGKNWLDKNDQKNRKNFAGGKLSNKDRSNMELYEWLKYPPNEYFIYINAEERKATTWTGQLLGKVFMGAVYISNFGDKRRSIDVIGNNGFKYHGIYYCSSGDYARIKQYKTQK